MSTTATSQNIKAGLFVLIGVALSIGSIFLLSNIWFVMFGGQVTGYTVTYPVSEGVGFLAAGSDVRIGGIKTGSVTGVQLEVQDKLLNQIAVQFTLPADIALYSNATVLVRNSLIGQSSSLDIVAVGWDIATACQEADKRGLTGLVSEQSIYHLDNRLIELEVIPSARHYGLGIIAWSPLGGGLLGGALAKYDSGRRSNEGFAKQVEAKRGKLESYEGLCRELGEPPAAVALSWLLNNTMVTAPIIGPRNVEQLESAVEEVDGEKYIYSELRIVICDQSSKSFEL